jgi:hypothetical protein
MSAAFADDVGADFYLAVNPDGMPHPDLLIEMVALARRHQGRVLVEASQFPEELPKVFDPLTLDTPWASGCCLLVPAPVFRGIGGFDESMFMYCEDVDLSWRARQAGYGVKHAPRALFHHRFNCLGNNKVLRRVHLESARILAAKWGGKKLRSEMEQAMVREGWEPKPLPEPLPSLPASSVADFSHHEWFAPTRWTYANQIPAHIILTNADVDDTLDIIVRFHDPAQVDRLSRCLFSLYGQRHQPIQILLMLQGMDKAGLAAVNACVDAFDWSSPRRRPIVTNVAVPQVGDHRARLWNAGLDIGTARYLGYCDYDDTVYPTGYSYLLHRLKFTGVAAAFASALHVDCTPMSGFDFVLDKRFIPGDNRYDFFVAGFCPIHSILVDRTRIEAADLRAEESMSKQEDYRVFATVAARYDTDWASIGTAVGDYMQRTDGTNTIPSHRTDPATKREWDHAIEDVRQHLDGLITKVPVRDIVRMRTAELKLEAALAAAEDERSKRNLMKAKISWRLTSPFREVGRFARRAYERVGGKRPQ